MDTVQILLVGGRQAPNVIGVLMLRPAQIELLVSKDERNKINILLESLMEIESLKLPEEEDIQEVDAYDFQSNVAALKQICGRHKDKEIQFNLTGSTKIMAIAAYEVAREEDISSFYVNTSGNRILWLTGSQDKSIQLTSLNVSDYLNIFGRKALYKFNFKNISFNREQALQAATILGKNAVESRNMLQKIRIQQVKGNSGLQIPLSDFNENERDILKALRDIKALDIIDDSVILRSSNDFEFFKGDWLEIFVFNEASSLKNKNGTSVFNSCAFSLRIPMSAAEKEIDVACMFEAQLIHCSCKTDRDPFKTLYLDELRSVSSMIGGRFCSRIFVTNAVFPDQNKQRQFLEQAKQREIVVVTGNELGKIGEILFRQAANPDYRRV